MSKKIEPTLIDATPVHGSHSMQKRLLSDEEKMISIKAELVLGFPAKVFKCHSSWICCPLDLKWYAGYGYTADNAIEDCRSHNANR